MSSPEIRDSLQSLERWIEGEQFRGWDPFDALNSSLLHRATLGTRHLGILWVQLFKRSPLNMRPLFRVPKGTNPKGVGLFLASYLRRYRTDGDAESRARVREFSAWLRENPAPGYSGACWGYNFPWPNRGFYAPAGTPTVVTTAFIGAALLEAGDIDTARSACDFVLEDLNRLDTVPDELCFSYTPLDRRWIYNASLLGGELLARVGAATGAEELLEAGLAAARFVARRQSPDGAWLYGVDSGMDGWVDSFHTGYVLCSLRTIADRTGSSEFDEALDRGYEYWKERMFREDGGVRYYAGRDWPVDAHAVAQAILTCLAFADRDAEAGSLAIATARWAARHLQDPDGHFHYQIHRRYRIRIPYMRWSQAWMQRALRELVWHQAGRPAVTAPPGPRP